MKAKIFSLLSIITIFFTACVKENFDTPPSNCDSVNNIVADSSIRQLKNMYDGDTVLITTDFKIEGTVISTDQYGNFYKKIIIQDTSGGIDIEIDDSYMFTKYPVGQKVIVNCKGLVLGVYRGTPELGEDYNSAKGKIIRIEADNEDKFILKKCQQEEIMPQVVSIDRINDNLLNTLVKIENVQFTDDDLNKTWADAVSGSSVNHNLEDKDANKLIVRTSGYASFAKDTIPSGSGTIIGVLGKYNDDYQLYIRNLDDVSMDGARF